MQVFENNNNNHIILLHKHISVWLNDR